MPAQPDTTLSLIEAQLQELQAALLSSDAPALEQGAQVLRQAAAALLQAQSTQPLGPTHAARVRALAGQLGQLRDQLARALALTQQQAQSLLPPIDDVTYGPDSGRAGAPGARIYRAPG